MKRKVSCHIITYNQKNFIAQCIEGVLMQQTDFDFELVIGDDNSTDGTREILIEYQKGNPDKIILNLRTERGKGIPGKENFVSTLAMCKGEYVSLCDGDDYWTDPLKLQKQIDFLDNNPDYVLCFHKVMVLTENGLVDDFITTVPEGYETIDTLVRLGNYIHTPSAVFRNIITAMPPSFWPSPIGDYFVYIMLARHGKVKCLEDIMAVYRHNVGVFSGTGTQKIKSNILMYACLLAFLTDENHKQVILERLKATVNRYDDIVQNQYKNSGTRLTLQRITKFVKGNYKKPGSVFRKIYRKIFI